ncbi:2,3-bisphosphoglycerate-independent phosphoglycerate mutase, partial [Gammaproteobacteria bacterium]|nr:2,3-bisphosphoglycerate-independent phosphoglycerate mutase [Gammaproteobacteria bacterium]
MKEKRGPLALIILDGWGYREETEYNAIAQANTPFWNKIWQNYPHTSISGSGKCVGLPNNQMGNSEVGHINIGAGRVVNQELTRIDSEISNEKFFSNPTLIKAIKQAVTSNKNIHILGLLSDGGVHSHDNHIQAIIELANKYKSKNIYLHAFLDGRDTAPKSAKKNIVNINNKFNELKCGKIASMVGRYYAMDRDKRWDRIEQAYNLLTLGESKYNEADAVTALEKSYQNNQTDEFLKPTSIHSSDSKQITINDDDTVIFMNFRADRAREITEAFIEPSFNKFKRKKFPKTNFVTLTEYNNSFNVPVAYKPQI